jgi:hypothetical protein
MDDLLPGPREGGPRRRRRCGLEGAQKISGNCSGNGELTTIVDFREEKTQINRFNFHDE